jgi:hypothetical protein
MGNQGPWKKSELLEMIQVCEYHEPRITESEYLSFDTYLS